MDIVTKREREKETVSLMIRHVIESRKEKRKLEKLN